jgi:predicted DNA-binding transcriptional regulator AlpA
LPHSEQATSRPAKEQVRLERDTHVVDADRGAVLLRTSRKAIYTIVERAQLPGVVRIGRRVLVREDTLLDWLRQKSTPSLER